MDVAVKCEILNRRSKSEAISEYFNHNKGQFAISMKNLGVGLMLSEDIRLGKSQTKIDTLSAKKYKEQTHEPLVTKVRGELRLREARLRLVKLLFDRDRRETLEPGVLEAETYRYLALLGIGPIVLWKLSWGHFEVIVVNLKVGTYCHEVAKAAAMKKCKIMFVKKLVSDTSSLTESELVKFVQDMESKKGWLDEYRDIQTGVMLNFSSMHWIPEILTEYRSTFGSPGWRGWRRHEETEQKKDRHARKMKKKNDKRRDVKMNEHAKNITEFLNVFWLNELSCEIWVCSESSWEKLEYFVMARVEEIKSFFRIFSVDAEGGGSVCQMSGWSSSGTCCFVFQGNFFPMALARMIWSRDIVIVDSGLDIVKHLGAFRGLYSIPFHALILDLPGMDWVIGLETVASRLCGLDLSFVKNGVRQHRRRKKTDPLPDYSKMDDQSLLYADARVSDWNRRRLFAFQKVYATIDSEVMQEVVGLVVELIIGTTKDSEMVGTMRADDVFLGFMDFSKDKLISVPDLQHSRDVGHFSNQNFHEHTMGKQFLIKRWQEKAMSEKEAFDEKTKKWKEAKESNIKTVQWLSKARTKEMYRRGVFYAL